MSLYASAWHSRSLLLLLGASAGSCLHRHGAAPARELRFVPAVEPFEDDPRFPELAAPSQEPQATKAAREAREGWEPYLPLKDLKGGKGPWRTRLLVWPEGKFAFCYVEKVAGTQFNVLMNVLNHGWDRMPYPHCKSAYYAMKVPFDKVRKDKGWKIGIFLRDPAERLLSAWRSKCQLMEEDGFNCLGQQKATNGTGPEALQEFERMATEYLPTYMRELERMGDGEMGFINAHYDPQSLFCGGRRIEDYDFVGHLSGDHAAVRQQVVSMMTTTANVSREDGRFANFWHRLDQVFPANRTSGHSTGSTSAMATFYRSPAVYDQVTQAYRQDYEKLGLARGHFE